MFKRYRLPVNRGANEGHVDFYVHTKKRKSGFTCRAAAIGIASVPRLDDIDRDWNSYSENTKKLLSKSKMSVSVIGASLETYPGKACLVKLWDRLSRLNFVDMGAIAPGNPFACDDEPEHEDLPEPDKIFGRA